MSDPITPEIRQFVHHRINSVEQLELLLLLRRTRDRTWTAESASRELRTSPHSVDTRMKELIAQKLAATRDGEVAYDADHATDQLVGRLEQLYAGYRVRIISLIFDRPSDAISDFADAFRVRKDR